MDQYTAIQKLLIKFNPQITVASLTLEQKDICYEISQNIDLSSVDKLPESVRIIIHDVINSTNSVNSNNIQSDNLSIHQNNTKLENNNNSLYTNNEIVYMDIDYPVLVI